jgi:hypothetical protein
VDSWRKSFDVNRNMLFAISPAMNGSSQNDSAVQAQKRPVMLSEKVREVLRLKHYSLRTEEAYLGWMRRLSGFITVAARANWARTPCGTFCRTWPVSCALDFGLWTLDFLA